MANDSLQVNLTTSIIICTLQVRGQVITGPNRGEQMTFIDISHTLWSQADGEQLTIRPNHSNAPATQGGISGTDGTDGTDSSQSSKLKGKLQGEYTWPFSIDLPRQVVLGGKAFSLPQTFYERHARASITYEVSLQLARGKLRTDHRSVLAICNDIRIQPLTRII